MSQTHISISSTELSIVTGVETEVIVKLVEYGIVEPLNGDQVEVWEFETSSVHWIQKALRLRKDLEIDWLAVSMVIELMQQKEALEKQNAAFQRQLSRFTK